MAKRDRFEPENSYLLWLLHSFDSILYTDRFERVIIDYDEFINEPKKQLQIISNQIGLHYEQQAASVKEFEEEFLDHSLRHNFYSKDGLKKTSLLHGLYFEFYNKLLESASTQVISNKHLVNIVAPFIKQSNLINFFATSEINRRKLNELLSRKTLECNNVIEKSESRQATIEEQHEVIGERQALIEQQKKQLEQQKKQLEHNEKQLEHKEEQIHNQTQQKKYLERQVTSIYTSRSWRLTKPLSTLTKWFRYLLQQGKQNIFLIFHKLWGLLRKRPAASRFVKRFLLKLSPKLYNRMQTAVANRSNLQSAFEQSRAVSKLISSTTLPAATRAPGSLAVHVHMYYPDLCGEFADYLGKCTIFI